MLSEIGPGHTQKRNFDIFDTCDNMDGSREYYAKWNKPDREIQTSYNLTYT